MDATPRISYICLNLLNILLHGLGFLLLLHLYRRGQRSSQRLYLLNLSLAEILQNALRLTIHGLVLQRTHNTHRTIGRIGHCILNVANTGVYYLVFMSVFLLTGDRLLCVGMRYTKVWTIEKCLNIIKCTWVCNMGISMAMFLYTYFHHEGTELSRKVDIILTIYVPTTLFITFLVFAVITYTIMFCQFVTSSRQTQQSRRSHASVVYTFRQSKFFMSLIIISAFLVLMVIPGLVATFTLIGGNHLEKWYEIYLNISVTLNDTADGLIYVFLQPDVKRLFINNISCICRRHKKDQYVVNSRTTFEISGTPQPLNSHIVSATFGGMTTTLSGMLPALVPHQVNEYGSISIMKLNIPATHEPPDKFMTTLQRQRCGTNVPCGTCDSELSPLKGDLSSDNNDSSSEEPFGRMMVSSMSLKMPPYPLLSTFTEQPRTPTYTDEENEETTTT